MADGGADGGSAEDIAAVNKSVSETVSYIEAESVGDGLTSSCS